MFDVMYSANQFQRHDLMEDLKVGKTGDCWEITVGMIVPCGTVEVGGCLHIMEESQGGSQQG